METKGLTCKIPLELHNQITEEIRASGSTMSKFIEMVLTGYYTEKDKGAVMMEKTRTLAFQISEELFQKIKAYLAEYKRVYRRRLTQKEFVIGLIEQTLAEAEEEFEAARVAYGEPLTEQQDEPEGGQLPEADDAEEDDESGDDDTEEDDKNREDDAEEAAEQDESDDAESTDTDE